MNVQETRVVPQNQLDDLTYSCNECHTIFHYCRHEQDVAVQGILPVEIFKALDIKEKEITIELPLLARFFLYFINFFDKEYSAPEPEEKGAFYGCVYDNKCKIYYKIPYEVR